MSEQDSQLMRGNEDHKYEYKQVLLFNSKMCEKSLHQLKRVASTKNKAKTSSEDINDTVWEIHTQGRD